MGLSEFRLGLILGLLLTGCASFSYHFYGLSQVVYQNGQLLGPTVKDDLPFSACAPNSETKHPCVILFAKDFFALKLDYEDAKMRLSACEKK